MASSKPEIKKPGSGSLLAPSKFGANFGRADNKRLFTGLKASKLTSITQSVCGSSTTSPASQPQNSNTETASGTIASSNPFSDPSKTLPASSCTPLVSKVTLNTGSNISDSTISKESTEKSNDTSTFEIKVSEGSKNETSGFVFGQNLADRAANFAETNAEDKISDAEKNESKTTSSEASTGFVFGQNLAERVSNKESDIKKDTNESSGKNEKPPDAILKDSKSNGEGKSNDTLSQASSNSESNVIDSKESPTKDKENKITVKNNDQSASLTCKTLNENAAEYFESHLAAKRKYDEVEVITGEENEHNVLHMSAKLYIFEKNKGWVEKGRGELRLNDLSVAAANASNTSAGIASNQASRDVKRKVLSSRIVMRTVGSLRVILNTKVYHGMSVEKPSEKSIRLTGMEDGEVKVFLISATHKDTDALNCALKSRLAELKSAQEEADKLESKEQKIGEKSNDAHDSDQPSDEGVSCKKSKIEV